MNQVPFLRSGITLEIALICTFTIGCSTPRLLLAQDSLMLSHRVRVTAKTATGWDEQYVGVATSIDSDTLKVLNEGLTRAFHLNTVRQLEASQGRLGNARRGALVGAGAGAVLGLTALIGQDAEAGADLGGASAGAVIAVPLGALIFGGIGAIVGAGVRTEHWADVPTEQWRVP